MARTASREPLAREHQRPQSAVPARSRRPPVRHRRRPGPAARHRRGAARGGRPTRRRQGHLDRRGTARASGRGRPAVSDRPSRTRIHSSPGARRHRPGRHRAVEPLPERLLLHELDQPRRRDHLGRRSARRRPFRGRPLHHPRRGRRRRAGRTAARRAGNKRPDRPGARPAAGRHGPRPRSPHRVLREGLPADGPGRDRPSSRTGHLVPAGAGDPGPPGDRLPPADSPPTAAAPA